MTVLSIEHLHKQYGKIKAVDDLQLQVEKGMVFGLLGPNGSGKTTTLGIILGIIQANSGTYTWFEGQAGNRHRLQIGALLETPNFYPYLNAMDNLGIVAHIKRVRQPNFDAILKLVNLYDRRYSKFRTFSLGMKQRLAIAAAMVGDPEVLIFDEPTNGLDPQGIAEVRHTIKKIADTGKTIIMASHILDEVEKICSHVAIIKSGRMLASGTVGAIISDDILIEVAAKDLAALENVFREWPMVSRTVKQDDRLQLFFAEPISPDEINRYAFEQGLSLSYLQLVRKSLESEFLEITAQ